MEEKELLTASKELDIRFSEVDSMNIVWHGAYVSYFEDAREAFGARYGLGYLDIFHQGFYAPLVDMHFSFKQPLIYGERARVEITYVPTEAAKLKFTYQIFGCKDNRLIATGDTTQVFLDMTYKMVLYGPDFYLQWKKEHGC